jgi:hypothetical protein
MADDEFAISLTVWTDVFPPSVDTSQFTIPFKRCGVFFHEHSTFAIERDSVLALIEPDEPMRASPCSRPRQAGPVAPGATREPRQNHDHLQR